MSAITKLERGYWVHDDEPHEIEIVICEGARQLQLYIESGDYPDMPAIVDLCVGIAPACHSIVVWSPDDDDPSKPLRVNSAYEVRPGGSERLHGFVALRT